MHTVARGDFLGVAADLWWSVDGGVVEVWNVSIEVNEVDICNRNRIRTVHAAKLLLNTQHNSRNLLLSPVLTRVRVPHGIDSVHGELDWNDWFIGSDKEVVGAVLVVEFVDNETVSGASSSADSGRT